MTKQIIRLFFERFLFAIGITPFIEKSIKIGAGEFIKIPCALSYVLKYLSFGKARRGVIYEIENHLSRLLCSLVVYLLYHAFRRL